MRTIVCTAPTAANIGLCGSVEYVILKCATAALTRSMPMGHFYMGKRCIVVTSGTISSARLEKNLS